MAKPSDDIKKKAEQRYMILQMISSQIQELQKELESIEGKSSDLSNLRASLGTLSSTKEGAKALSPVGLGIFAETELKSISHVFVGVGAGVMVKKTAAEAEEMAGKQLAHLDSVALQITENLNTLTERAQELEKELQDLLK